MADTLKSGLAGERDIEQVSTCFRCYLIVIDFLLDQICSLFMSSTALVSASVLL